jgi:hypothetical protein
LVRTKGDLAKSAFIIERMTEGTIASVVERLDFGRLDAENDENLQDYFLDTGTVDLAKRGKKLVIGRKGAGKTALFKILARELQAAVVELDLDHYVWEFHRGFAEAGLEAERAYTASWKLLIYLSAYGAIRDDLDRDDRTTGDAALETLGLASDRGRIRAMVGWLKRVRRVDLPEIAGLASGGGFELGDIEGTPLSAETARAIHDLEALLARVRPDHPFTVLIDRLDDAWNGSDDSLHLIAGAVRATRDIGMTLKSGMALPPVITFLRADLWERISFNDRNKMSQDIILLDWTPEQLTDVIALRVASSLGVPREDAWSAAFTTDEMRQRARASTYITKRTLGRPRDIVAFAIFAHEEAQKHGHEIIEATDIYEAERRFSRHVFDELKDEMERHVADFQEVTNALKSLRQRTFQMDDWMGACKANGITVREGRVALEALLEASIVGIHATGGSGGGSGTVYRYEDRHLQARDESNMQVHLALVKELGLRDT